MEGSNGMKIDQASSGMSRSDLKKEIVDSTNFDIFATYFAEKF